MAQIGFGPLERVDGPLPVPAPYGLLQAMAAPAAGVRLVVDTEAGPEEVDISSTGMTIDEAIAELKRAGSLPAQAGDLRWINGAQVFPYPPGQASAFNACGGGSGSTDVAKDFGQELASPEFSAITVYVAETCASYKVWNQAEYRNRAITALNAVQGSALARQLLTGEADPLSPHLADGNGVFPIGTTAVSAIYALSILEEMIGLSGQLGLIHCSPGFVDALASRFQIDNKSGVLRTFNGNVVIPDAGYARAPTAPGYGSPPSHPSTGTQEWIYATGPIDIRLSEIFMIPEDVSQALDRGTANGATLHRPNRITYRAERYGLAVWDTELQVGVLADKCFTGCTS